MNALLWAVVSGCVQSDEQAPEDQSADPPGESGADSDVLCAFQEPPVAQVTIEQRWTPEFWDVSIEGRFLEGTFPTWHEVILEQESCRYLVYLPGNCNPPCDYDEICTGSGDCTGWPSSSTAGTMTVEGLGAPVTIEPETYDPGAFFDAVQVDHGELHQGDTIVVSTTGDSFPALDFEASAVGQLHPDIPQEGLSLSDEQDLVVTWDANDDGEGCVELTLYTASIGHGLPITHILQCVGEDDGDLSVPQVFLETFPPWTTPENCAGIDCPLSELTRYQRRRVATPQGDAWLTVKTVIGFPLLSESG